MYRLIIYGIWQSLLLCFFVSLKGQAQGKMHFKQLDVDKGLSQNSVVSIAQDSLGYLWFATQDGLNKYSGSFENYQRQFEDITRQSYNKLGKVYCDKEGILWSISKNGGLEYLNLETNALVGISSLSNVNQITQVSDETFWLTTKEGILINTKSDFKVLDTLINNPSLQFFDIKEIESKVYIASSDGVLVFEKSSEGNLEKKKQLSGVSVSSIDFNDSSIYFGTFQNGLYVSIIGNDKIFRYNKLPSNIVIYKVLCDSKNRIWIGTYGEGLYIINDEDVINYTPKISGIGHISYHDILDIYEDISGVIWIGTDGGGVNFLDEYIQKFNAETIASVPSNVSINVVRSIYSDANYTYCGTSGKGLTIYNKKKDSWQTLKVKDGLKSDRIMSLQKDDEGDLWVGNQFDGLSIIENINGNEIEVNSHLNGMTIWCMNENISGQYLCGTQQSGLVLFDKRDGIISKTQVKNSRDEPVSIRVMAKANDNRLFLGTDNNGLFVYNIKTATYYQVDFSTNPIQKIKSLLYFDNQLFVGSNGSGLIVLDAQTLTFVQSLTIDSGLSNNVIYAMYSGSETDFWISTNKGISELELVENSLKVVRSYNLENGLQSYEFNTGAHFKSEDGTIYFGGINGINWFNPSDIPLNPIAPKTMISEFKVSGENQILNGLPIMVPHDKNNFTVSLATTQLSLPSKNKFKYRLRDFENEWQETKSNLISYMNVDAGNYFLEVLGANYDGTWSENIVSIEIEIQEVWYFSWWFKSFLILCFLYTLYSVYQSKKKRLLLLHAAEQQNLKTEYLHNLNETRSRFFTNITHELLTPLTVIRGISGRIEGNQKLKYKIANNSNHLIELVNQILMISKRESGFIKYDPALVNVISYFKYITDSYNSIANDKHISLNFYSEINDLFMDIDPEKVKTVLGNIIMNALKYTPMYGKVIVVVKRHEDQLLVSINDNGIGMDEITQENIFDRFYQSGKIADGGAGVGLSIVKELCEVMDVAINVDSQIDVGTQFQLVFDITAHAEPLSDSFINFEEFNGEHIVDDEILKHPISTATKTVLLVEDNNDVADYIMQVLALNYSCTHLRNGQEALEFALTSIPDIIITDIMMPVMDGIDLLRILKNDITTNHIPIIVLTAKITEQDKLIAIQSGANAYLTKPFSEAELLIRIDALLAAQERSQAQIVTNAILEIQDTKDEHNTFLNTILETIESNISNENLSIQELCDAVNLERTQVYRKLKAISGKSASQLIKEVRLEKAKSLIENQELSISQVAYACGYKDVSYFSKSFKKYFGMRPSDI